MNSKNTKNQKVNLISREDVNGLSAEKLAAYRQKSIVPFILQLVTFVLCAALMAISYFMPINNYKTVIVNSNGGEDTLCSISYNLSAADAMACLLNDTVGEDYTKLYSAEEVSDSEYEIHSVSVTATVKYLQSVDYSNYLISMNADDAIIKTCDNSSISSFINEYKKAGYEDFAYEAIDEELKSFGEFANFFVNEIGYLNIEGLNYFASLYRSFYNGAFYVMFSDYAEFDEDNNLIYDYDEIKENISDEQLAVVEEWFNETTAAYLVCSYGFSLDMFAEMNVAAAYAENTLVKMDLSDILYASFSDSYEDGYSIEQAYSSNLPLFIFIAMFEIVLTLLALLLFIIDVIKFIIATIKRAPLNYNNGALWSLVCLVGPFMLAIFGNIMAIVLSDTYVIGVSWSSSIVTAGIILGIIVFAAAIVAAVVRENMIKKNNKEFFNK